MSFVSQRGYAVRRALAMVRDAPLVFLLAIALSAAALAVPMAIVSLASALGPAATNVRPAPEVSLLIAPDASTRDIEQLKTRLAAAPGVASVRLIPRDAALAELAKRAGTVLAPSDLAVNPLPDVLVARLTPGIGADRLADLAADTRRWPRVDKVRADTDWYLKLAAMTRVVLTAAVGLGSVVAVLVTLIVIGTVRLHATARADEIQVLRLAGATNSFIVRPYAYSAALTLSFAAAVAAAIVVALHAALAPPITAVAQLYGHPDFRLGFPDWRVVAAAIALAALLGGFIGHLGARAAIKGWA